MLFYIREFIIGDEKEIYQLFYETVHHINSKDYTEEQINIWAPKYPDLDSWQSSLAKNYSFVAIDNKDGKIIGFSDLEKNGHLNRGYVHKDYQGQGIGKALLNVREVKAKQSGIKKLFAEVSITAKPFFEKCGYGMESQETKNLNGVLFINYRMTKDL